MSTRPHPFTLRQLQYAVAVADTLSFRKAAALCRVSQPSLSAQIAQVEEALGLRLFERDRRRVLLTSAGREVLERARRLLVESDDLVEVARRSGDPLRGTLRLGIIPTVSPYFLPLAAPALRRAFPELTPLWTEERTAALAGQLREGGLDAAVVALESRLGEVDHEVIGVDPFLLATPRNHPLGAGKPVQPSELRDVEVLVLEDGHCLRDQVLSFCSRARAHELEFRATSLGTLAQMVAGGVGVTLLPGIAIPTEADRARLRVRPFASPAPSRTIALVWRPRSPLAPALRNLARALARAWPRG